jgi:hypothetical protein
VEVAGGVVVDGAEGVEGAGVVGAGAVGLGEGLEGLAGVEGLLPGEEDGGSGWGGSGGRGGGGERDGEGRGGEQPGWAWGAHCRFKSRWRRCGCG